MPDKISRFLQYAYFLRFPTVLMLVLAALGPLGTFPQLHAVPMAGGLLDLGPWDFFFVSMMAFLLAWGIMVTWRMVLEYGVLRFGVSPPRPPRPMTYAKLLRWSLAAFLLLACAMAKSEDVGLWQKGISAFAGFCVAVAALYCAGLVQHALNPTGQVSDFYFPIYGPYVKAARKAPPRWACRLAARLYLCLPYELRVGLFRRHYFLPGHSFAVALILFLMIVYFCLYLVFDPAKHHQNKPPALFYLLLLLWLYNWGFSAASFILDRFRMPVLLCTLIAGWLLSIMFPRDHVYEMLPMPASAAAPANAGATDRTPSGERKKPETVIIVAAAGGGIQAAGWTATVLGGLQKDCQERFSGSLRLVSGISGGSVGAMHFLRLYDHEQDLRDPKKIDAMIESAKASSLSDVGWGMVFPDYLRTVLPFTVNEKQDRGWALEQTWRDPEPDSRETLWHWRQDAQAARRPYVIFNSTLVEAGQQFQLGTDLEHPTRYENDNNEPRPQTFFKLYPERDLPITTAVRLSAAFTLVSPTSRPANDCCPGYPQHRYHLADGGYYDNYGMHSALRWYWDHRHELPRNVKFVQIVAFPESGEAAAKSWNWQHQLLAPLETLLNVRTTAQRTRNGFESEVLKVHSYLMPFSDPNPPLSWHLTKSQRDALQKNWEKLLEEGKAADALEKELGCRVGGQGAGKAQ